MAIAITWNVKQLLNLKDVALSLLGQLIEGLAVGDRRLPAGHRNVVDLQTLKLLRTVKSMARSLSSNLILVVTWCYILNCGPGALYIMP